MKAIILAAGYGKRLRPLTETTPKPLIEVGGKPLIQYHLENLADAGVKDVVINVHWLADRLIDTLGDGTDFGLQIRWSRETELLETGGGIRNALPMLGNAPFLLVNGDVYFDYSLRSLVQRSLAESLAHLVLVPNPEHHHKGDFCVDDEQRLSRTDSNNDYTYAGAALIDPKLFDNLPSEPAAFPLLSPLLSALQKGLLTGEVHTGLWEDVGTIERLNALNQTLLSHTRD